MKFFSFFPLALFILNAQTCNRTGSQAEKSADAIEIGSQIWMTMNLSVTTYNNGDTIKQAKSIAEWNEYSNQKIGCCSYYYDNNREVKEFGKLYNWYAVVDSRGLAPKGWSIPTISQLQKLLEHTGGMTLGGKKLKSTNGWIPGMDNMGGNGDNSTGFNAQPGGVILTTIFNEYARLGKQTNFWSRTQSETRDTYASCLELQSLGDFILLIDYPKTYGFYIRCIKE